MKVKEFIEQLKALPQDDEIILTSMDDKFSCSNFEVHSDTEDGVQEIIIPYYIDSYTEEI